MIRPVRESDAAALSAIYNHYIMETAITFDETPLGAGDLRARIAAAQQPWLVYAQGARVTGYAYLAPFRAKPAFRYSAELTIYLEPGATGKGVGSALMEALLPAARQAGLHALVGVVTLPNPASAALLEKFGFAPCGRLRESGYKLGRWHDVGFWERLLPGA
jgi:phosphinothricin acetyltransferase